MKTMLMWFTAACFLCSAAGYSVASPGTKVEAKALVEKGVLYIKANGKNRAIAEFNNSKGKFIDRDLYMFAFDFNGVAFAHGANAKMVGKNMSDLQDADGKYIIKGLIEVARKGSGWFDYKWSNPITKKIQDKSSYVVKIDDGLFIGCGVYK